MQTEVKSIVSHLSELRARIIVIIISVLATSILAYFFSSHILEFLISSGKKLGITFIFLKPTEAFMAALKISLLTGIVISSPLILYQFWAFIVPAFKENERKVFLPLVVISPILFLIGASFSYIIVLPIGLKFLLTFGRPGLQAFFSISEYISFVTFFLLAFGIVFELPLIVMILNRIGLISLETLRSKRKHAIVAIYILAALLTPGPDSVSAVFLALPLILLYEISILIVRICNKTKRR